MNKTMVENQWIVYKYQPNKDYPSIWYFWINPDGIIKYCRSIEPLGFMPIYLDVQSWQDKKVDIEVLRKLGCVKYKTELSQEYLSRGIFGRK